ncbi:DNA-binding protein [Thalassobacillus devorans]|uniref:DNA-binding protein n=1 Tax=Thalassobacillus devorans TaxID=279813 RepID=A0ABQ1P503_9BACI|nr:cupin domain-containing protein [Thalassobacillus devorans]NIK28058.1 transcriptional regulator with XRE-family HTH domain [Thalassobacillus devorans]GGC89197.1 DNA-binding protein [Thalassobacillus devorans]
MEDIYKKIKELRLQNGLTLKGLSEKTDLSVSFLSQVERGDSSLAITSLKKIADAFGVPMASFFEDPYNHNYAVKREHQKPFKIEGSDLIHTRLGGHFPERKMEPIKVTLSPNQQDKQKFSHPGEEFYYVLKGMVIFVIEGKEYLLKEGDAIHFPSVQQHQWENPLSEETELLCVLTPVIF